MARATQAAAARRSRSSPAGRPRRPPAGGDGEDEVAVDRRVRGPQRPREAVVRHDGEALRLRLGQRARRWRRRAMVVFSMRGRLALVAERAWRRPGTARASRGRRIRRRPRRAPPRNVPVSPMVAWPTALTATSARDRDAAARPRRGRAEPAFEVGGGGAGAGAGGAESEVLAGRVERRAAERRVGRDRPSSCRRRSEDRRGSPPARSARAPVRPRCRVPWRAGPP